MKKTVISFSVVIIPLMLSAWGRVGHETVAIIAEHHLTPQAKDAIKTYLGGQSLAEVSNWADEVKGRPEYIYIQFSGTI